MFGVVETSAPDVMLSTHETGALAADAAKLKNEQARELHALAPNSTLLRYRVVKLSADDSAKAAWRAREQSKFDDGTYTPLPWDWCRWANKEHYAHVSKDKALYVAFTEDDTKGIADRQTRMRPGAYLQRYYSDWLSAEDVKEWCAKYAVEHGDNELLFARTADEIEHVYTNGPTSCMSHSANEYDSPCHPVRVYAAGDLAIAYIENDDTIQARALCWPEKKWYSRVYGYEDVLTRVLEAAGYSYHSMQGARMKRIPYDDGFVVPYLDSVYAATDDGDYLIIESGGEIDCQTTNGISENYTTCARCGDSYDGENDGGYINDENWCPSCYENHTFYCEDCNETYSDDDSYHHIDGHGTVCDSCISAYSTCDHCNEPTRDGNLNTGTEDRRYCDDCASDMKRTHCGLIADDENDCDCSECDDERAYRMPENFALVICPILYGPELTTEPARLHHDHHQGEFDFYAHMSYYDSLRARQWRLHPWAIANRARW